MIRHLLKLVWNRKRTNGLLILEIFFSFLVVFVVLSIGITHWERYRRPLGFDYRDVWTVYLDTINGYEWVQTQGEALEHVRRELAAMDEVVAATRASSVPYDGNTSTTSGDLDGRGYRVEYVEASIEFAEVFQLNMIQGRWFDRTDLDLEGWKPIVLDRHAAVAAFGDEDPLGQVLEPLSEESEYRVIGVVDAFRKQGELGEQRNFAFFLHRPDDSRRSFAILLRPGAGAEFEERMIRHLQAIAPEWTVQVQPLAETRVSDLKLRVAPLIALGVIAGFLLIMVALGLIGVLWQNVTQRTREIGLRRAAGAHPSDIHKQIVTELLLMTTLGLAAGLITVVQFPVLGVAGLGSARIFAIGVASSVLLIYGLATLCALYPSWMATRIQPAEALHHE